MKAVGIIPCGRGHQKFDRALEHGILKHGREALGKAGAGVAERDRALAFRRQHA